jgi:hypothetical protein
LGFISDTSVFRSFTSRLASLIENVIFQAAMMIVTTNEKIVMTVPSETVGSHFNASAIGHVIDSPSVDCKPKPDKDDQQSEEDEDAAAVSVTLLEERTHAFYRERSEPKAFLERQADCLPEMVSKSATSYRFTGTGIIAVAFLVEQNQPRFLRLSSDLRELLPRGLVEFQPHTLSVFALEQHSQYRSTSQGPSTGLLRNHAMDP